MIKTTGISDETRSCLKTAEQRAIRRSAATLTPTLLFLGIAGAEREFCEDVFERIDARLSKIEQTIMARLPKGSRKTSDSDSIPMSDTAKLCLERARRLSSNHANGDAKPVHLLFAVIEGSPDLANVLKDAKISKQQVLSVLAELGGMPEVKSTSLLSCGPLMLHRLGRESDLGRYVASRWAAAVSGKQSDDGSLEKLMFSFSQLGIAAVHVDEERPLDALEAIAQLHCDSCNGRPVRLDASDGIVNVCDSHCSRFPHDNLAYADLPDGVDIYRRHTLELALKSYRMLMSHSLSQPVPSAEKTRQHFLDAEAVAVQLGKENEITAHLSMLASGRANALTEAGRIDDAIDLVSAFGDVPGIKGMSGKQTELLTHRGVSRGNDRNWRGAVEDLTGALAVNSRHIRARTNLSTALRGLASQCESLEEQRKYLRQAEATLVEGEELTGGNEEFREKQVEIRELLLLSETDPATFRGRLELEFSSVGALLTEAVEWMEKEEFQKVEELVEQALAEMPNSLQSLILLSHCYVQQDRYRDAISIQRRIGELDSGATHSVHFHCGILHEKLDELEAAEEEFRLAIKASPDVGEAYVALGHMLHQQKRLKEAKEVFLAGADKDDEAKLISNLAIIAIEREEAEAQSSDPDSSEASESVLKRMLKRIKGDREPEQKAEKAAPDQSEGSETDLETLMERLDDMLKAGSVTDPDQLSPQAKNVDQILRDSELKYRWIDESSCELRYQGDHVDTVIVRIRVENDFMITFCDLPEHEFRDEADFLKTYLKYSYQLDGIKLALGSNGALSFRCDTPIRLVSNGYMRSLLSVLARISDLSVESFNDPSSLESRIEEITLRSRFDLLTAVDSDDQQKTIPELCESAGVRFEDVDENVYALRLSGPMELVVICQAIGQMVSMRAVFGDMQSPSNPLVFFRRIAELNSEMEICKLALNSDSDVALMAELPTIDQAAFDDAISKIELYAIQCGFELSDY